MNISQHMHHPRQQQQHTQQQQQLQMAPVFAAHDQGMYEIEQQQQPPQAMTVVNYGGVPTAVAVIQPQATYQATATAVGAPPPVPPQSHIHSVGAAAGPGGGPATAVVVAGPAPNNVQTGTAAGSIVSPAEQHESNVEMFPPRDESTSIQNLQRQPPPVVSNLEIFSKNVSLLHSFQLRQLCQPL